MRDDFGDHRGYDIVSSGLDPQTREEYWQISFGLQRVDGLEPSAYARELARDHIAGQLPLTEAERLIYRHYRAETEQQKLARCKEADLVATRIHMLLCGGAFPLNSGGLQAIHGFLFRDIYDFAGEFRRFNISKSEPILRGASVKYTDWTAIAKTLAYDFNEEAEIRYGSLTDAAIKQRLARFAARIWQVHPFAEGNTRTTAVFLECYLRDIGFAVDNRPFKERSTYFRNALVRAAYADFSRRIDLDYTPLERFFDNLLFGGRHELHSRDLMIV